MSLAEFARDHPGVVISPPGDGGYTSWIARRDGLILAAADGPEELLGILGELLGPP